MSKPIHINLIQLPNRPINYLTHRGRICILYRKRSGRYMNQSRAAAFALAEPKNTADVIQAAVSPNCFETS